MRRFAQNGRDGWLLNELKGEFTALAYETNGLNLPSQIDVGGITVAVKSVGEGLGLADAKSSVRKRYDMKPGTVYLFRPDQHVAARWRSWSETRLEESVERAAGRHA